MQCNAMNNEYLVVNVVNSVQSRPPSMNRIGWTDVDGKRDIVDVRVRFTLLLLLVDVRLAAAAQNTSWLAANTSVLELFDKSMKL